MQSDLTPLSLVCSNAVQELVNNVCVAKCPSGAARSNTGVCGELAPATCHVDPAANVVLPCTHATSGQTCHAWLQPAVCREHACTCPHPNQRGPMRVTAVCTNGMQELVNNFCVPRCPSSASRNSLGVCGEAERARAATLRAPCWTCFYDGCVCHAESYCKRVCADRRPPIELVSMDPMPMLCSFSAVCTNASQELVNNACVARCPSGAARNSNGACGEHRNSCFFEENKHSASTHAHVPVSTENNWCHCSDS